MIVQFGGCLLLTNFRKVQISDYGYQAYDDFYKFVIAASFPAGAAEARIQKTRIAKQYEMALVGIYNLGQQRIPDAKEPKIVTQLFTQLEEREIKIKSALARVTNGNELTPEAIRRQSLRQPGRVFSKGSAVEKKGTKK